MSPGEAIGLFTRSVDEPELYNYGDRLSVRVSASACPRKPVQVYCWQHGPSGLLVTSQQESNLHHIFVSPWAIIAKIYAPGFFSKGRYPGGGGCWKPYP